MFKYMGLGTEERNNFPLFQVMIFIFREADVRDPKGKLGRRVDMLSGWLI